MPTESRYSSVTDNANSSDPMTVSVDGHLPPEVQALPLDISVYAQPENSIGYLLRMGFRGFSTMLERKTSTHGVSSGQWRFLRQLWIEDGPTQRELSVRVGMREPTTVVAVNSLVKSGLAVREPSVEDRRKVHIRLTPLGRSLQATLLPMVADVNDRATKGLTKAEIATLQRLLRHINGNMAHELEQVGGDAVP